MAQCELLPHEGYVFLEYDPATEAHFVVHGLSRERARLEPPTRGEWAIHWFEDGFGAIVDDGEGEVLLDEILKTAAYIERASGKIWLVTDTPESCTRVSHQADFDKHVLRNASVKVGSTGAQVRLQIACFTKPRKLCCIFWDLLTLYEVACFVSGKGVASHWLYRGISRWERHLSALGLPGKILRSKPAFGEQALLLGENSRVLLFPSIDTIGLLVMLAAWSVSAKGSFGMLSPSDRESSKAILRGLCRSLGAFVLHVYLDKELVLQWPAKPVATTKAVRMEVSDLGLVDLRPPRTPS